MEDVIVVNTGLVGCQWGDEGKGKVTDILAKYYDITARYQGGANAGHTIERDGQKIIAHLIPSGIVEKDVICVMGNGMVIDPIRLMAEIAELESMGITVKGRLKISTGAHLITPWMISLEEVRENKVGSTKRAIGPAYELKARRDGVRASSVLMSFKTYLDRLYENANAVNEYAYKFNPNLAADIDVEKFANETFDFLREYISDTTPFLYNAYKDGKKILLEGAQGGGLCTEHGTYPYVTSSVCTVGGMISGTGLPLDAIPNIIGIMKAYTTRVGKGPFPTKIEGELADYIIKTGNEIGASTGRTRDVGYLDLFHVDFINKRNGTKRLCLMKLDVLNGLNTVKICTNYEGYTDYPFDSEQLENVQPKYWELAGWPYVIDEGNNIHPNVVDYIDAIEGYLKIPVSLISYGPDHTQTKILKSLF